MRYVHAPKSDICNHFITSEQVIDYQENAPLYAYLEKVKSDQPFDYILDTVRNQELFEHSPKYLKQKGLYVNIGAYGTTREQLRDMLKNYLLPTFLGGTPRRWKSLAIMPNGELQRQVAGWIDEGLIKEVPSDSEISMDDVLKV
jgi:NADPH:quinone reductase-like Zn-dependent oxidoreductase